MAIRLNMLRDWYLIFAACTAAFTLGYGRRVGAQSVAVSAGDTKPGFSGPISDNILPMKRRRRVDHYSPASPGEFGHTPLSVRQAQSATTSLASVLGFEYVVEMEWSGQKFQVVVDTGSSDTYVAQTGFTCTDSAGNATDQAACGFASTFNGSFSGGEIPDQLLSFSFIDGEFINASTGFQDVTLAGLTAKNTQVGLANSAFWLGDNVTSGLMGLAFPLLTHAFNATTGDRLEYDPVLTTMIKQGVMEPMFSLAFERNGDGGVLALGGVPPVILDSPFASTPILIRQLQRNPKEATELSFYTIEADAYIFGAAGQESIVNDTVFPAFVDSGTSLMFLPTEMTQQIHSLFNPPATLDATIGTAIAPCNASVPSMAIQIGGQVFSISAVDMLIQDQQRMATPPGMCLVGVQDGGSGPFTLGDTFMNNVLSVFDIGTTQMHFAQLAAS